jgi:hypothetical protein
MSCRLIKKVGSKKPCRQIQVDTPLALLAGVRVPLVGQFHDVSPSVISAYPLFESALTLYDANPSPMVKAQHCGEEVAVSVKKTAGIIRLCASQPTR